MAPTTRTVITSSYASLARRCTAVPRASPPRPTTIITTTTTATRHLPRRRAFHSHDHDHAAATPPPAGPFSDTERRLLAAAHAHVPNHGFTRRALGLGARDAGFLDISPAILPDGPFALVRYHLVSRREALAARSRELFAAGEDGGRAPEMGVGAKVAALTWERLMGNKEIVHRWQEALALMAQPSCVPTSLKELAMLSDEIWFLAGDKAVDPSWYTKRASLSMVYSTSELFMTNDRSPDFADTHQFLARRLQEVQSVGRAVGSVGQWVGFTANAGINVLRSKGFRV